MNNTYQDQRGALPVSSFAPYFTNYSNSLWKGGIGNSVSNFVQATEDKLSQWFWQSISALPKEYFAAKDITNLNHFDKSLWEGIFNERIEVLQKQLASELTEQKSDGLQGVKGIGLARVDKLKEQMAAGLPKGKLSLEEQLIQLQGLVGKHTLSPQDYEEGLDALKESTSDNKHYTVLIGQVRSSFRSALKAQQGLLEECLQGDLLRLFKESPEQSFTPAPLKKILNYYKPLMKHKTYAKQKEWIEQCYNTQSLLPLPSKRKHITKSSPVGGLLNIDGKQDSPTWGSGIRNWGKFLWENSGKLMTLGLATQVAAVQASGANRTGKEFIPEENSTDKFPLLPEITSFNQRFLTDQLALSLNNLSLSGDRSLALGNDALVDTGVTTEANTFDKVIMAPANFTSNSGPDHGYHVEIGEELRQEVLHQFDKVIADLEDLQGIFSSSGSSLAHRSNEDVLTRMVRSAIRSTAVGPPTTSSKKCKITEGRLRDMNNNIQKALNSVSCMSSSSPKCTFNEGNLNKCDEWVTNILCGIQRLKHAFEQAECRASTELQNAYDDLYKDYEEDIANVRSSISEEFKGRIRKLETDMQGLKQKNNELKQKLEESKRDHEQTAINLCASNIREGKYEEAITEFKKWENNTMLVDIVPKAYDRNSTNIHKVIAFTKTLPWCEQRAIAFPVLYNQMQSNGHLSSPQILSLSAAMRSCIAFTKTLPWCEQRAIAFPVLYNQMQSNGHLSSPQILSLSAAAMRSCYDYVSNHYTGKEALQTLQSQLKAAIEKLIGAWGGNIRSGNYETIKAYANDYSHDFQLYLEEIVKISYNQDIYNAEKVIAFINTLPNIRDDVIGYPALFDAMTSDNGFNGHELIMLAYKVKQRMSNMGDTASDAEKQRLLAIKDKLPSGIRALLWDDFIYIKSREHNNNYLSLSHRTTCGSGPYAGGAACVNIFELKTCPDYKRIYVDMHEGGRYFLFKDVKGWSFYTRNDGLMSSNRAEHCNSACQWEVIPIENGAYFYFKNKENKRILDSGNPSSFLFWKSDCSNVHAYKEYEGKDHHYHHWSIS